MLRDFDDHMFTAGCAGVHPPASSPGYVEHIDSVASQCVASDWVANDKRFCSPAVRGSLDIASVVFMGAARGRPRTGHHQSATPSPLPRRQRDRARAGAAAELVAQDQRPARRWRLRQQSPRREAGVGQHRHVQRAQ